MKAMNFKEAASRMGAMRLIITAAVLVLLLLVNLLIGLLPESVTKPDVSGKKLYSLSDVSQTLVRGLNTPVTIHYYVTEGGEDVVTSILLQRYRDLNSCVTVQKVDPLEEPDFITRYTTEEIPSGSLVIEANGRVMIVSYYDLYLYQVYVEDNLLGTCPMQDYEYLAFQMQYQYGVTPTGIPVLDAEGAISGAIAYVTSDAEEPSVLPIEPIDLRMEALQIPSAAGTVWSVILIAVLPLAAVAIGVIVFVKRRKG